MFTRRNSSLLAMLTPILALGAGGVGRADVVAGEKQPSAKPGEAVAGTAGVATRSLPPAMFSVTAPAPGVSSNTAPVMSSSVMGSVGGSALHHGSNRNTTIIINTTPCPVYVPPCATYPAYPAYGYPYGYSGYPSGYPSGASVTVSTPGFSNGTFTQFPYSTTVTSWGAASPYYQNYGGYYPQYPQYQRYPSYPAYVPGPYLNGYRGAAGVYPQNFGGSGVCAPGFTVSRGTFSFSVNGR